jgi:hypothetical protein
MKPQTEEGTVAGDGRRGAAEMGTGGRRGAAGGEGRGGPTCEGARWVGDGECGSPVERWTRAGRHGQGAVAINEERDGPFSPF